MTAAALLLLADGRFPSGGHAHSGGLEAAVADGSVHDLGTLADYLTGRLHTTGALEAWAAARAAAIVYADGIDGADLVDLDVELDVRTWSPRLRAANHAVGRALRRSAAQCWPAAARIAAEHQAVVSGAVATLAGLKPLEAAQLCLHHHLVTMVSAAPKLMAVDMAEAMGLVAQLAATCEEISSEVSRPDSVPNPWSALLVEQRAIDHGHWEVRLFAS